MMGDNMPGCELNVLTKPGQDFGYPYVHQGNVLDPEFGKGKKVSDYVAPVQVLGPHVAPLGVKFVGGSMFPAQYQGNVLIAEHGSWNAANPLATASRGLCWMAIAAKATAYLRRAGSKMAKPGAARWTCCNNPTAACSSPTTRTTASTASATRVAEPGLAITGSHSSQTLCVLGSL